MSISQVLDESATQPEGATEAPYVEPKIRGARTRVGGQYTTPHIMSWMWHEDDGTECRISSPRLQDGEKPPKRPDGGVGYRVVYVRKPPGSKEWTAVFDHSVLCTGTLASFAQAIAQLVPHVPD